MFRNGSLWRYGGYFECNYFKWLLWDAQRVVFAPFAPHNSYLKQLEVKMTAVSPKRSMTKYTKYALLKRGLVVTSISGEILHGIEVGLGFKLAGLT